MTKQVFDKIRQGGTLCVEDLNADEKKRLYAVMGRYGMPMSTAYSRLFERGFRKWELLGITQLQELFLLTEAPTIDGHHEEGDARGYGYVLSMDACDDARKFYDVLTYLKMGVKLCDYMAQYGMASQMTVRTRFRANDWKQWELVGVNHILDEFAEAENKTPQAKSADNYAVMNQTKKQRNEPDFTNQGVSEKANANA